MNKHHRILVDNPEMRSENPAEYELRQELARLGVENDPIPESCSECGCTDTLRGGMAGETMLLCANCGAVLWEDSEGAIRSVF